MAAMIDIIRLRITITIYSLRWADCRSFSFLFQAIYRSPATSSLHRFT